MNGQSIIGEYYNQRDGHMIKVWGKVLKRNKIIHNHTIETYGEFSENTVLECLYQICLKLDLPRPIILNKHTKDLNNFLFMRFFPDDFIEPVHFDKMDVHVIIEKKKD